MMPYQLPPMALQQWRAPRSGVSLNYVPQQQQIGSPANAQALQQTMLPANLQAMIASLNPPAPAAPLAPVDPRKQQLGGWQNRSQMTSAGWR